MPTPRKMKSLKQSGDVPSWLTNGHTTTEDDSTMMLPMPSLSVLMDSLSYDEDTSWMRKARCKGLWHLFFAEHVHTEKCKKHCTGRREVALNRIRTRKAKEVCKTCPVVKQCLEWALRTNLEHGVAGGMTDRERKQYKNQTKKGR